MRRKKKKMFCFLSPYRRGVDGGRGSCADGGRMGDPAVGKPTAPGAYPNAPMGRLLLLKL